MTSELKYRLRRIGRRLTWPHPLLYCPIGLVRHGMKGYVFERNHVAYISGYPRSGNTFALKAFLLANPGVPLRSHRHISSFIVVSVKRDTPGMVLLRNPLDAAVSWSIYVNKPLHQALQYYEDYYSVLLPYRDRLFIVRFEDVIDNFGKLMRAFNTRWGTAYNCFAHTPENVALCMSRIEDDYRRPDGSVAEAIVARPSQERRARKEALIAEVADSPLLKEALRRAQRPYDFLSEAAYRSDMTAKD